MSGVIVRVVLPLVLFFIQTLFLPALTKGFIKPELLLCCLLSWALLAGPKEGLWMGVFCGLLLDISSNVFFGFYGVLGGSLGWIVGRLREQVYRDSLSYPLVVILMGTVAIQVILLVFSWFDYISFGMMGSWLFYFFEQITWNIIFMLPVYGVSTYLWYIFCE